MWLYTGALREVVGDLLSVCELAEYKSRCKQSLHFTNIPVSIQSYSFISQHVIVVPPCGLLISLYRKLFHMEISHRTSSHRRLSQPATDYPIADYPMGGYSTGDHPM